jgi:peptidylprolyl isomerase
VTPAPSSKIPALSASAPCVKTLYTVTRMPTTRLVYASPLLSPDLRDSLGSETVTYSLNYVDTTVGTGAPAAEHKFYTVKYTGYLASDGTKFDSSNDHPGAEPITFQYGGHRVIPGWDTGFEGMRVGGKRRLFVPWELAYGEAGRPPVIPPKSELIFDVELVSQSDTPPTPPAGQRPGMPGARSMPPGAVHPQMATPPAGTPPPSGTTTQTPPAGNPPASGTPAQPQGATPKPQKG